MELFKNNSDDNNKHISKINHVKNIVINQDHYLTKIDYQNIKYYSIIRDDPGALANSIKHFDNIINCVHQLALFIPKFENEHQAHFWKEIVISNLNSNLTQEAHARQIIRQCFSIIYNLAQNILKLPRLLKADRAKFAKKRFPNALAKLIDNITALENLENNAMVKFENQTQTIFDIPGAGALDILSQVTLVQEQLNKCTKEKEEILVYHEKKQVNMNDLEPLIEDLELQINRKQNELFEINLKLSKLDQVISNLKLAINGSRRVRNYPRTKYHVNLLKFKRSCIEKYTEVKKFKLKELAKLSGKLCDNKAKYESEKVLMNKLDINSTTINYLQDKLDKLQEDMTKMEQQQALFEKHQDKLGIKGQQYIKFLVRLRLLARAIKYGVGAYAPIISILNEIKSLIQSPIELTESEEESDVALAERLLSRHAQFLSSYSWSMRQSITKYHHKRSWLIISEHILNR